MSRNVILMSILLIWISGCSGIHTENVVVTGVGDGDLLKLRSGPGLNYDIVMGLPDGTALRQDNCVGAGGLIWCQVSLWSTPRITGYVAARYLMVR